MPYLDLVPNTKPFTNSTCGRRYGAVCISPKIFKNDFWDYFDTIKINKDKPFYRGVSFQMMLYYQTIMASIIIRLLPLL